MNCPLCNKQIGDTVNYCRYCGRKIVRCPTCGRVIPYRMRFCPQDRTELPESLIQELPEQNTQSTGQEKPIQKPQHGPVHNTKKQRSWQTQENNTEENGSDRTKTFLLLGVISLLVVVLGVGVFWCLTSADKKQYTDAGASIELNQTAPDEAREPEAFTPEEPDADTYEDGQPIQTQIQEVPELLTGASGFGEVPLNTIEQLSQSISCEAMNTSGKVQGVEWNTDTMETFYICYGSCIVAYDKDGNYVTECNDVGEAQLFSIDYYDGKVISVMRSSGYSRLKLRVYDADTLELINSVNLDDIKEQHSSDKKTYHYDDLKPFIGGVMVAPDLGTQKGKKLYICYNAYFDEDNCLAQHDKQMIFVYDYKKAIKAKKSTHAERVLKTDLGAVKYGIQTLEYDRKTGNVWCGVYQGLSDYPLYCVKGSSDGKKLSLVKNGSERGWNCPMAESGLCSLGNDRYYVLVPQYSGQTVTAEIRKVSLEELESIDW